MAKEKFILVSLKDDESKKLAQIITNDTSRKILDYLAEKEATESELAEKLGVPISTIHYNLQALLKGRLIEADEYHYSEKGKEVLHYKLANKYIIIAPKTTYGIKEKLKSILPVGLIALAGSFLVYFLNSFKTLFGGRLMAAGIQEADTFAEGAVREAVPMAEKAVAETAPRVVEEVLGRGGGAFVEPSIWQGFLQNPALWFLFGCMFTLLLIIVIEFINYKKNR